ncbi:hypothetical protein Sjap_007666 [Stephania japonica]|uniref:Uncharacterized protein n=1 Tax=Stephania japonica TaxID=461633 RepID=A0AAP0JQE1_9MAGN
MVKKKFSQISKVQKRGEEGAEAAAAAMVTQMEEKIANLKSLNELLLKETCERRREIDEMAKERKREGGAEAEAARVLGEKRVAEEAAAKAEMSRRVMVSLAEEVERLRERVERARRRKGGGRVNARRTVPFESSRGESRLKGELEGVVKEKRERDFEICELKKAVDLLSIDLGRERKGFQVVTRERDEIRKCVNVQMEELRGLGARLHEQEQRNVMVEEELGRVLAEMRGLVEERKERDRVFESLRTEKHSLECKLVESLRGSGPTSCHYICFEGKEKGLRSKIYELGKCNTEALEKQDLLRLDFGILVEEKRETEENLKLLLDEKVSITTSLEVALLQLKEQKNREDGIVHEKVEIEQKSAKQEFELLELRKEISRLQDSISALRIYARTIQKPINSCYKSVDGRKRELVQLRKESSKLFEETKGTKSRIETLMEEKRSLKRSLSKTEEDFKNLGSKMKSYELYVVKIFELLSDAAKVLCPSKEAVEDGKVGFVVNANNIEKELNLVGAELDAIKKTYMSKDEKVEELMKELEVTKNSLKEAHQKKSFWTLMSSATTVVVAASLAYYSRVR